jgi:hypothetical protein
MSLPATAKWIGLALLGLLIAAAVALAASRLTSQQIGLASESITAGDKLAPAVRSANKRAEAKKHGQPAAPPATTTSPANPPATIPPTSSTEPPPATIPPQSSESGDDHGGHEGGGGSGGGGPDD